ncbi:patatin-like phospholipase family protein [Chitinophaga barathri]|uniref:Patatin-like phospholipase family protein n=1 Tax=Chitinophaga barathri TaxID=1647451 RepID=A0A3N4MDV5_9BACT|nr:patatin-like phospholipase family protein [Chitinophaga barathri]RPD42142.1 patatin-like phospholipase family protein [Chitinophaga barathri]
MPVIPRHELGLSLSGGGYRAAAFHLGTLNKLNDLHILDKVSVLSTISGGTITGAAWCLYKGEYKAFHEEMKNNLQKHDVIRSILRTWTVIRSAFVFIGLPLVSIVLSFTSWAWLTFLLLMMWGILLMKYQFRIFDVSKVIERAYDRFLYHGQKLRDLKGSPILVIGSSNLHTGRPFYFGRNFMSDSMYSDKDVYIPPVEFNPGEFPIARAVMASSCIPFVFSPVKIDACYYKAGGDFKRVKPVLVDGGVYDNQGISKITQPKGGLACRRIITSDAGGPFMGDKQYKNTFSLLLRTMNLFMYRIKTAQMVQHIYTNVTGRPIAYYSLGWDIKECLDGFVDNMLEGNVPLSVIQHHNFPPQYLQDIKNHKQEIKDFIASKVGFSGIAARGLNGAELMVARNTGTNLTRLSEERVNFLIRHAEDLTELQVKLYCPDLIN